MACKSLLFGKRDKTASLVDARHKMQDVRCLIKGQLINNLFIKKD